MVRSRRMIRSLFTAASVLSLLVCAATVALWVRSDSGPTIGEETLRMEPTYRLVLQRGGSVRITLWRQPAKPAEFAILFWPLAPVGALLPVAWMVSRWRPRRSGLCTACGYDLRAIKNRCPECGPPIHSEAELHA